MKNIKKITFKNVRSNLKTKRFGFSPQLFWFVFLTLISLTLAYIFPLSLIATLPFVIIPSWFSFNSLNVLKGAKNVENVSFFLMYKTYFSEFFFGGYRALVGILKGFFTYLLSSFVSGIVYDRIILSKSAEYQAILATVTENGDIATAFDQMMEFSNRPEFQKPLFLISAIAVTLGIFVFIQHLMKHSLKMRRNLFNRSLIPMKQFHLVDREVRRKNRKLIWSSYFSSTWFVQLMVIIAYAGGLTISYFLLKEFDVNHAVIISTFLSFVLLIPAFNYISIMQFLLFLTLQNAYEETFVSMTLDFLAKFKDKIGIEEEQAQKIEQMLKNQKQTLHEEGKQKEEEKDVEK